MTIVYLVSFTDITKQDFLLKATDISAILNDGDLTVELWDGTLIHGIDRLVAIVLAKEIV